MSDLSHLNAQGEANMVDVTAKAVTTRQAIAEGFVRMNATTLAKVMDGQHAKGDVLAVARIAGILGAKKTSELIPLCHPLMLTKVKVDFTAEPQNDGIRGGIRVTAMCKLAGQTGVEMEALTAVSTACLTLFDMCKAVDKTMVIEGIRVLQKQGGKSGDWQREVVDD